MDVVTVALDAAAGAEVDRDPTHGYAGTPSVRVGKAHAAWTALGASPWLVRQLRFGLQLPWTGAVPYRRPRAYPMGREGADFVQVEVERWLRKGFVRQATTAEARELTRAGQVFPSFVTQSAGKSRLVVDYKRANECMEARTFRMDQISDLASVLR